MQELDELTGRDREYDAAKRRALARQAKPRLDSVDAEALKALKALGYID